MATYNQISYGSKGSDVTELQKLLNQNGYTLDTDGIFGSKTQAAVKDYQQKNSLSVDGIVGKNTWGALSKAQTGASNATPEAVDNSFKYDDYAESDIVKQAQAMLQQQMANKPGDYQSSWQSQLNDTLNKILNREQFSYDLNGDALYQQYKDQYTTQGKMAMMDTMGQAAALTGGYGSSYGQSVGQQAYQGYLQGLNDKVPELYNLALSKYQMEGDALYNQAALMAQQEDQDYGRYRDQVADYYTELDRLYNQYNTERDYDYGKWADGRDFAYQTERDKIADQQWQAQFDEAKRQFDKQYALSASKGSGSSGGSSRGNLTAEKISRLQSALGVNQTGVWDSATKAAAEKMYGTSNPDEVYEVWHHKAKQSSQGIVDFDSAISNLKANGVPWEQYAYLRNEEDFKKQDFAKDYANYKDYLVDYVAYCYDIIK